MRFIRSRQLVVERQDGDSMILCHSKTGTRLEVNRATYELLELFREPRELGDLASCASSERPWSVLESLRRSNFLVEENRVESIYDKQLERLGQGFFGVPIVGMRESSELDIVFIGVPYDSGGTREPGARFAPRTLREISSSNFHFAVDAGSQASQGWYDNDLEMAILETASLGDLGNIAVPPADTPEHVFRKIHDTVAGALNAGALPVVIGGDHSITYAVVSAFDSPVSLIQIDAHSDRAPFEFSQFENHHGNVMSRLIAVGPIRRLYQVGVRGTAFAAQRGDGERIHVVTPRRLRIHGIPRFVDDLPDDGPYYVSFDIDSLDPIFAPATSTPVPGGLTYDEAKLLLREIGRRRACVGFDLVEVNPRRDLNDITTIVALELLLSFLGAWYTRRRESKND